MAMKAPPAKSKIKGSERLEVEAAAAWTMVSPGALEAWTGLFAPCDVAAVALGV